MGKIMKGKPVYFVSDRKETQRGVMLNDGRVISLFDKKNKFYLRFDYQINLTEGVFFPTNEHIDGCVSLNDLLRNDEAVEVHCYDSVDYDEDVYPCDKDFTGQDIADIKAYFNANGYNVTEEAISHQIKAWKCDMKSGYRDEENGYHLFSPCGCNPLSIRLSTLHHLCEDWQRTYEC